MLRSLWAPLTFVLISSGGVALGALGLKSALAQADQQSSTWCSQAARPSRASSPSATFTRTVRH